MAKIRFLSAGASDGCTFYRCSEPARALRERGHDALSSFRGFPLGDLAESDAVVFQRSHTERAVNIMTILRQLRTVKGYGPTLVYEADDDFFAIPPHLEGLHEGFAQEHVRETMRRAIRLCDRVTVTNAHLGDRLTAEANPNLDPFDLDVRVVPNWVPERFVVDAPPPVYDRITIGWAGSVTHRKDFEQLYAPLGALLGARSDVDVHVIGDPMISGHLQAAPSTWEVGAAVHYSPWSASVDDFLSRRLDFHIGLAPLVDDLFNRSKSDVKVKEYAARGIVPVASEVGPYAHADVPCIRVRNAQDWAPALELACRAAGAATGALAWAKANTLEAHADQWEDALLKGSDQ